MGKSYNNVIKLSELFSGNHPILEQAYHPMVVRFYILQTHYRSTLDFGNEALQAAERAARRLWEAYDVLQKINHAGNADAGDAALDKQVSIWCNECTDFMNDDFNTAKVIANLFELAPVINGMKGGQIKLNALSATTFDLLKTTFKVFLEDILGMQPLAVQQSNKLAQVLQVLMDIRADAKKRKDFATSDQIRNKLAESGVLIKDEKDGTTSFTLE
jgi:cysteinyl-tRNA synthetase